MPERESFLRAIPGPRLFGAPWTGEPRAGVLVRLQGVPVPAIVAAADAAGIGIRGGE